MYLVSPVVDPAGVNAHGDGGHDDWRLVAEWLTHLATLHSPGQDWPGTVWGPSLITALSPHTAHSQDRTGAPGLLLSPADTHMGPLTGNIFGKNDITPPSHSLKKLNTSHWVISEVSAIFTWDQGPLPPACPAMSCSVAVAGPAPPPTQHRLNPGSLLAVVVIINNAM